VCHRCGIHLTTKEGSSNASWDASNNYWGTTDARKVEQAIEDYKDVIGRGGPIKYGPFLTEVHPDTP